MEQKEIVKQDFIQKAVEAQMRIEVEKLVVEAKKELEKRTPEIIAGLVVSIMGMAMAMAMAVSKLLSYPS